MLTSAAVKAYNNVSIESEIIGADPHKLISILFRGALLEIAYAKAGIQNKQIMVKGAAISKAIAIIAEGLNACLDKNVGGELAQNLSSLYDYMVLRLIDANLKNDLEILDEVSHLLSELKEAWDSIRPGSTQTASTQTASAQTVPPPPTGREQRVYGSA